MENLIEIGVDGANVMVGKYNSFSTHVKAMTNRDLVVIKCVCHSLHLAAEHSFKSLPKHLDFLIKESHNWFSCSSKLGLNVDTMTERVNAINKILDQWDVLKLHFQLTKDRERCYTSQQLFEMLDDKKNYLYKVFLKKKLRELTALNTAFQSDQANSLKLMEGLLHLLRNYLSILIPPMHLEKVLDKDIFSFNFKDYVMSATIINFGYSFHEAQVGIERNDVSCVQERCRHFLIELCYQIQSRLPFNIEVLEKINLLTPENATSQVRRPDITTLTTSFKSLINEDVDATVSEWNRVEWEHPETAESFWVEVSENKNTLDENWFERISKLALALLSLPFSNAATRINIQLSLLEWRTDQERCPY
ncbi:unnamed protein product [Psylliodes chrysocephalus]|uniref:Uncharacterized protein n=1 Tax=Psylliodes chrysocephalus TaxID=3402493 RepID=A0A9P0CJU2_9CUCU|nr:unnamed protein product [Psylliodes chrysocephala]